MSCQQYEKKDIVKLTDKVEVIASAKDPYHKPGQKYFVHPKQVDYLLGNGMIESDKPAAKVKAKPNEE